MINTLKYIAILIAVIGIFWASNSISFILRNEITKYPVRCKNEVPTIYDCVDALPLNRTTYKVDKKNQIVISWMPGFEGLDLIERYENCVVLDRKNWTCEFNDESGKFGFNSGNFVDNYSDSDIIYVTKAQWKRADASVDSLVNN